MALRPEMGAEAAVQQQVIRRETMKVIIQCASRKHGDAGKLRTPSGEAVAFVAHPELIEALPLCVRYYSPDDTVEPGAGTWRDTLNAYNEEGQNPCRLRRAVDLYKPKVYRDLVEAFGWANVFILSAGWDLIQRLSEARWRNKLFTGMELTVLLNRSS